MRNLFIISSIVAAFFLTSISSYAGDWSKDQEAVWAIVNAQWQADKSKDYDKWGGFLADDFKGWSNNSAMPSKKAGSVGWNRFNSEKNTTLKYELSPVGIVVHGDAAIAHYYYVIVNENSEGKRKSYTGRWSDVLVRDGKSWKFIGWQGGPDSDDE